MKLNLYSLRQGMASLTLVLIVVTLISLIMLPIFLITYIRNTQAVRFYHSQQAFFAAEGAYAETVARLKLHEAWGKSGVSDNYFIGPNEITRTILWLDPPGEFQIAITSNNRLAQRKIEGVFTPSGSTSTAVDFDIMLVMDYSVSMRENCPGPPFTPPCPIAVLQPAAINLINKIQQNPSNRIGAVKFSGSHPGGGDPDTRNWSKVVPLINTHNDIQWEQFINNTDPLAPDYITMGGTNLSSGLYLAKQELLDFGEPHKSKVIIFFSDGVPQHYINLPAYPAAVGCLGSSNNDKEPCNCDSNECTEPASIYSPYYETIGGIPQLYSPAHGSPTEHYGSFCTNQAINIASDTRNLIDPDPENQITIYSVFLQNAIKAACYPGNPPGDQAEYPPSEYTDRVIQLGRLTSFNISSEANDPSAGLSFDPSNTYQYYMEAATATDITDIFDNIITIITTGGSSTYDEVVPD